MTGADEIWLPLVDEPIGSVVEKIERDDPAIARIVSTPQRILAFRTFAYIRVGLLLGQLLVDEDVAPYDGTETWIDALLRNPAHAEAIARGPGRRRGDRGGPALRRRRAARADDAARSRFREFARERLQS